MLNSIFITADFLATKESEQSNNIRWFTDILKRPLLQATNLSSKEFKSAILEPNGFVRRQFFELSSISFNPAEVQFDFDSEKVTEESISYLKSYIPEHTLVIGYELSNATRTILSKANITYIDVWLHPIRYLDDVLFAFRSNNSDINNSLKAFNLNEDIYYSYADRLRVQNYRGFRRPKLDLHENSALFVGQTLYDKAISSNGKMLSLLDFKSKFDKLCKSHSHVYYSRHPFVKSGDEDIISFVAQHKNVTIIDQPAYFLLASDEIKKVTSISSSVVHEAKYFSKETEFFFQPVISIGNNESDYTSVYQAFLFGHFWASVLKPQFEVNTVEKTEFLDSKDKIRDMLSFYWGYRNIDKVESLKQTVGTIFEKKNNVTPIKSSVVASDWRTAMEKSSVISFDVFDTLVSRSCYFPTDVFSFMEGEARKATNGKVRNFRSNRLAAEKKTRESANTLLNRQEVTTNDIYLELQRVYELTDSERDELLKLELSREYDLSVRRDAGWAMFQYAKKLGKEIIAISDMTHEHSFICSLLEKSQYTGITKVFVSSQFGLRKHEGELYSHVINDLKVSASDVLHIGDNIKGDLESSTARGLMGYHIPRASVHLERAAGYTHFIEELKSTKTEFDSHLFSIISRNYFDRSAEEITPKTLFNGNAFNLGFCGLGPAITGFASWIYSEAISGGITDIFFLSRDGLIAKKVFDRLYGALADTPKTHYIYSSRRAARVSTIYCLADILEIANKHIYSTTIENYLWSRFGLEKGSVSEIAIREFGFSGGEQSIGGKTSKDAIIGLVESLKDEILATSQREREAYLKYLESHHLLSAKSSALVDIGYAGSMQAALQRITNKKFLGLYFATFTSARNEALDTKDMRGYVAHLMAPSGSEHGIQSHRFVYESIFCAAHDSFICIKENEQGLNPIFDKGENDDLRISLINQIHSGVEKFASIVSEEHIDIRSLKVEPKSATRILDHWLRSPTIDDALILEGLQFHDPSGPSSTRYVLPPREMRSAQNIQTIAIWQDGLKAIQRLKGTTQPGVPAKPQAKTVVTAKPVVTIAPVNTSSAKPIAKPVTPTTAAPKAAKIVAKDESLKTKKKRGIIHSIIYPFEYRIIKKTCSPKKFEKYSTDRRTFFADAKKPLVRAWGRYSSAFFS
ncbi:hypothetical protein [Pseudomonas sp. CLCA07]